MKSKHISLILKLIRHLNISQNKKKIIFPFKKEILPILLFLQEENIIYNFVIKKKMFIITFKSYNNINFLKKIKIFNFKNHSYQRKLIFFFLQKKNMFRYFFCITSIGLLSLEKSIILNKGGFMIARIN